MKKKMQVQALGMAPGHASGLDYDVRIVFFFNFFY